MLLVLLGKLKKIPHIIQNESARGVWRTDLEDIGPDPNTGVTTTGLRTQHKEYQNKGAYDLLSPTDWYVTRKAETGTAIPVGITSFRNAVRTTCESRKVAISSATSVESLCGITTFPTLACLNRVIIHNGVHFNK